MFSDGLRFNAGFFTASGWDETRCKGRWGEGGGRGECGYINSRKQAHVIFILTFVGAIRTKPALASVSSENTMFPRTAGYCEGSGHAPIVKYPFVDSVRTTQRTILLGI